jgi:hypothetical protein
MSDGLEVSRPSTSTTEDGDRSPKTATPSRDLTVATVESSAELLAALALMGSLKFGVRGSAPMAKVATIPEAAKPADDEGLASRLKPEVPSARAVDVLLIEDVRNLKVQLEELLQDLRMERSDAVRYVRLAKAKRFYEQLFPELAHGKASKDPKSGSSSRPLAFVDYTAKKTGWSRASIGDWASTGEHLDNGAFQEMLGTKLANRAGALKKLRHLDARQQLAVARGFRVGLERDALNMLDRYHDEFKEKKAREALQAGEQPLPVFGDDNNVVVPVSAEGIECTLHGHLLRISVEGEQVRVRYLAQTVRPHVLVKEGWLDAVESAARTLRTSGYEVDVSPIEAIRIDVDAARHEIKVRAWKGANVAVVLVTRWETACHAGPPLFRAGRGHDWQEVTGPVITVARPSEPHGGRVWSIDRADLAGSVEAAIRSVALQRADGQGPQAPADRGAEQVARPEP